MPFVDSERERKRVIKFSWWLDGAECDDGATLGMKGKKLKCFLIFNYRIVVWCSACIVISFSALILSYFGGGGELIWDFGGMRNGKLVITNEFCVRGWRKGCSGMSGFKNVGKMSPRIAGFRFYQKFHTSRIPCRLKYSNHILIFVIFFERCVLTCRYQTIIALITPQRVREIKGLGTNDTTGSAAWRKRRRRASRHQKRTIWINYEIISRN